MEDIAKPPADIKIVFFDLDDTLCAYWEAAKIALRHTFETHLPPGHTVEEMLEQWSAAFRDFSPNLKQTGWYASYLRKGESTRTEQMRLMLERMGIEDPQLAKRLGDTYAEERNRKLTLFPEAKSVLDELKRHFPLGLITNGPADTQRDEIAALGIGHYFDHVFIEGEMGKGKPLPEVFEEITAQVGHGPTEILFVGNSYAHDVRPALDAGWHALWIRRDTDVPPSSSKLHPERMPEGAPEPDRIIHDLREVLEYVGIEPAMASGIKEREVPKGQGTRDKG